MQVTAKRGDKIMTRNKGKWKLVRERPIRLQPTPRESPEEESDDDDWCYDLDNKQQEVQVQVENTDMTGEEEGSISGDSEDSRFTITYDDQEDRVEEVGHQITKSGRAVVPPDRFSPDTTSKMSRLSPRERKRRQSMRKKEKKTRE